ncbi:hypothetical protein pEaSNUABM55_00156 [Erwinia phage pEa_SNUABM_55]|nr:hypothetical protein pEaSNUABM55_00156 [Erwinia phage pEa_SNUABM_55]
MNKLLEPTHHENAREKLKAVENWLGDQEESMSYGLKTPEDALKLYDYWDVRRDNLPEFADIRVDDEGRFMSIFRKDALGYDPLDTLPEDLYDRAVAIYANSVEDDDNILDDQRPSIQNLVYDAAETAYRKEYGLVGVK